MIKSLFVCHGSILKCLHREYDRWKLLKNKEAAIRFMC